MEYTAAEVAEMVGRPYSTLMRWVQDRLLHPQGARGGHRRPTTWHAKDIREASILSALRRAGYSLHRLRGAMAYLRSLGQNPFSSGEFIVIRHGDGPPSELVKLCDTGQVIALIRNRGQLVLPLWTPDQEEAQD